MVDTMVSKVAVVEAVPAASLARKIPTEELAVEFLERARADVWGLVGPGGLLADRHGEAVDVGACGSVRPWDTPGPDGATAAHQARNEPHESTATRPGRSWPERNRWSSHPLARPCSTSCNHIEGPQRAGKASEAAGASRGTGRCRSALALGFRLGQFVWRQRRTEFVVQRGEPARTSLISGWRASSSNATERRGPRHPESTGRAHRT